MPYQRQPNIQGGGFYNPYSDSPNWGQGISQAIREGIAKQEQSKASEEEQRRYEDKQEAAAKQAERDERRTKAYEQSIVNQSQPTVKPKSAFMEKYELFKGILKNPKQAAMIAANFKEPESEEEKLRIASGNAKVREYWKKFYKGADEVDDMGIADRLYKDINSRIKTLTGDKYSIVEMFAYSMEHGGQWPLLGKNSEAIKNLLKLSDHVAGVGIEAAMGQLSNEELNGLFKIATNLSKFESSSMEDIIDGEIVDTVKESNELTGNISEEKVPKGTEVQKGPDGKEYVNVGGKWYTLIRKQK